MAQASQAHRCRSCDASSSIGSSSGCGDAARSIEPGRAGQVDRARSSGPRCTSQVDRVGSIGLLDRAGWVTNPVA